MTKIKTRRPDCYFSSKKMRAFDGRFNEQPRVVYRDAAGVPVERAINWYEPPADPQPLRQVVELA